VQKRPVFAGHGQRWPPDEWIGDPVCGIYPIWPEGSRIVAKVL
jgi:hypothetical protein